MRRLVCPLFGFLALGVAVAAAAAAADADALVRKGLAAETALDTATALHCFLQADALRPNDPAILQKISKQYSDSTLDTTEVAAKRERANQALAYAQRAHALAPDDAVCTLSLAVCYGKLGLYADTRTRIADARRVQHYAEAAIRQDPHYAWAYHVLGRWNYEVAKLGATKRFLVNLIFGGLPDASNERAVALLEHAVKLQPNCVAHRVDLGLAYRAAGDDARARASFQTALSLPSVEKPDDLLKRQARAALTP